MDGPANHAIFRDREIGARVITCHRSVRNLGRRTLGQIRRASLRDRFSGRSDRPQADRLGSFLTVGHINGYALALG
jgi:hypothetical protein